MMTHATERAPASPAWRPAPRAVLQRKCACGGTPGPAGECEQCRKKRQGLQRQAASAGPAVAPPIVHDVLASSGAPLDSATRAFMEPRFGHSFADVRVHTDSRAAQSAAAVGALAYTVGRDVSFAGGRYAPQSGEGRRLLAHELAHVVQQQGASAAVQASLEVGPIDAPEEREAEAAANAIMGISTHETELRPHLAGMPKLNRRSTVLSRAANCDSAEASFPFSFDFEIEREIKSRSFTLPADKTELTLEAEAGYLGGALVGSEAGDFCFELLECGWFGAMGSRCIGIDSGPKKVKWTGLNGGKLHFFRIWKGENDKLTISGQGTAS